jgi:hypothetical protein
MFSDLYNGQLLEQIDQVKKQAISDAQKNEPKTSIASLSLREIDLQNQAEAWISKGHVRHQNEVVKSETLIDTESTAILNGAIALELKQLIENTRQSVEHACEPFKNKLKDLKRNEIEREAEFNAFRMIHNLDRPALYPASKAASYITIASLIVLEALFNAYFYGVEAGLFIGLIIAFTLSACVTIFSAVLGHCSTNINYRTSSKRRAYGWTAIVVFVFSTFMVSKVCTIFRDQYIYCSTTPVPTECVSNEQSTPSAKASFVEAHAIKKAIISTLNWPLAGLTDLKQFSSLLILFWSLLVTGIAFWKGYRWSDPHPGYEQKDRDYQEARDAYRMLEERLRSDMLAIPQGAVAKLSGVEKSQHEILKKIISVSSRIDRSIVEYKQSAESIVANSKLLIKTYRETNSAVRTTPAPMHFASEITINVTNLSLDPRFTGENFDRLRKALEGSIAKLGDQIVQLREEANSITEETHRKLAKFIDSIREDALHETGQHHMYSRVSGTGKNVA